MARKINYEDDELITNPFAFAEQAPVLTPVSAPVVQAAAPAVQAAAPVVPVATQAPTAREMMNGVGRDGQVSPLSQTQGYGMVPVYQAQQSRGADRGPPVLIGYEFNPYEARLTTIDTPKPESILAVEQQLGGKQLEPIYATYTQPGRGRGGGGGESVAYGPPIGYRYDNGQSQYVNFDASGEYQGTVKRQSTIESALPILAIAALPFVGPALFEALGLTGAGAGAAGGGGLLGEAAVLGGAGEVAANLTPAAIESLLGTAGYGVNASALEAALAAGIPAATVGGGLLGETAVLGGAGEVAAAANLTPAAIESLLGTAGYGVNASALETALATGIPAATVGAGAAEQIAAANSWFNSAAGAKLTPAAMESLLGTAGYGVNASALEAAAAAGIPAAQVGAGALDAFQGATVIPPKLTPAAIESGLGTPGYGVNASAIESGLFNPETIGAGAYLPFDGVTPSIATVPEPSSLPSWATIPNALMAAGLVSSIAKANETAPTTPTFTMAPYVPPSGKPFANIAMSPIATPYTPTRILGQYDPTMTPGGVSPYELIMQQMQAPKNLYADFEAGTNIGGFDPQRFVTPAAPSNFNGGMIDKSRMVGPNPMGPDNGFASIQDGEFVMNRKATQKYGIELMNAINSGKISKGKLSGLLEA
jgi:hypothetical protein